MNIIEPNRVRLCGKKRCCPEIKKQDNNFIITDDYNGKVTLTEEEFLMLREAVEHFKSDSK